MFKRFTLHTEIEFGETLLIATGPVASSPIGNTALTQEIILAVGVDEVIQALQKDIEWATHCREVVQ